MDGVFWGLHFAVYRLMEAGLRGDFLFDGHSGFGIQLSALEGYLIRIWAHVCGGQYINTWFSGLLLRDNGLRKRNSFIIAR